MLKFSPYGQTLSSYEHLAYIEVYLYILSPAPSEAWIIQQAVNYTVPFTSSACKRLRAAYIYDSRY